MTYFCRYWPVGRVLARESAGAEFQVPFDKLSIAALSLLVAGCVGQPAQELLGSAVVGAPVADLAGNHSIFVATTRERSNNPAEVFDGGRSGNLNFARVNVTVPRIHEPGRIERRKRGSSDDPSKYFMASDHVVYDTGVQFMTALAADTAARGGRAMLFVHGYNTGFDNAVYRLTQIAHDSGYAGTPVLFSWASGGKATGYVYDKESASAARDHLEQALRILARSGARRIDIVAHSMGTWITMEALRQLAITGDRNLGGKLGDVVLASPDIDVDVFKSQMRRYGKPEKPFILLHSEDDRALKLSGILAGSRPRVGGYADRRDLAEYGVTVVDLSGLGGDKLNHTKFAENPMLVKLLGQRLLQDDGFASERELTDRLLGGALRRASGAD